MGVALATGWFVFSFSRKDGALRSAYSFWGCDRAVLADLPDGPLFPRTHSGSERLYPVRLLVFRRYRCLRRYRTEDDASLPARHNLRRLHEFSTPAFRRPVSGHRGKSRGLCLFLRVGRAVFVQYSHAAGCAQHQRTVQQCFRSVDAVWRCRRHAGAVSQSYEKATELRSALSDSQFELFYRAQVRADGTLLGAEALLRWNHPKRGYIPPADFIALAQQTGFMPTIGAWVIAEACKTLARWQENPATQNLTLSINITADHFVDAGFSGQLLDAASSQGIKPQLLKLELTESVFLFDIEAAIAKMKLLDRSGFTISLDDFGTGYSSLSYLRQLPLKQIKIDRSFVTG